MTANGITLELQPRSLALLAGHDNVLQVLVRVEAATGARPAGWSGGAARLNQPRGAGAWLRHALNWGPLAPAPGRGSAFFAAPRGNDLS